MSKSFQDTLNIEQESEHAITNGGVSTRGGLKKLQSRASAQSNASGDEAVNHNNQTEDNSVHSGTHSK